MSDLVRNPEDRFSHDAAHLMLAIIGSVTQRLNYNSVSFIFIAVQIYNMSLVVRKPAFCICENKDADQLRGNREADQRLYFRYTDSTIPLLPKSEISSL